jgi:hypothetical protein
VPSRTILEDAKMADDDSNSERSESARRDSQGGVEALGGGTAGTGGLDASPASGAGIGAAGVASAERDDTGGLTLGERVPEDDGESVEAGPTRSDSEAGNGLRGVDAGSPGGMGGVRVTGGTGSGRPPGGVSPLDAEEETHRRD